LNSEEELCFEVHNLRTQKIYIVNPFEKICDCPDFQYRTKNGTCKHIEFLRGHDLIKPLIEKYEAQQKLLPPSHLSTFDEGMQQTPFVIMDRRDEDQILQELQGNVQNGKQITGKYPFDWIKHILKNSEVGDTRKKSLRLNNIKDWYRPAPSADGVPTFKGNTSRVWMYTPHSYPHSYSHFYSLLRTLLGYRWERSKSYLPSFFSVDRSLLLHIQGNQRGTTASHPSNFYSFHYLYNRPPPWLQRGGFWVANLYLSCLSFLPPQGGDE